MKESYNFNTFNIAVNNSIENYKKYPLNEKYDFKIGSFVFIEVALNWFKSLKILAHYKMQGVDGYFLSGGTFGFWLSTDELINLLSKDKQLSIFDDF